MMSCLANNKRVWARLGPPPLSHGDIGFIQPSINRKPYPLYQGWGDDNNKLSLREISDKERKRRGKKEYEVKEVTSLGGADGEDRGGGEVGGWAPAGGHGGKVLTTERLTQ